MAQGSKVSRRLRTFHELKSERFARDPEEAIAYLNAVLEENGDNPALVVEAIKSVASSKQVSVEKIAKIANKSPSTIHKALSHSGNPSLETLTAILKALGLKLEVAAA